MPNDSELARAPQHFDPVPLLQAIGDDIETYGKLAEQFVTTTRTQIDAVALAVENGDAPSLRDRLHALRGSLAVFHARAGLEILAALEVAAKRNDPVAQRTLATQLAAELDALHEELSVYRTTWERSPA